MALEVNNLVRVALECIEIIKEVSVAADSTREYSEHAFRHHTRAITSGPSKARSTLAKAYVTAKGAVGTEFSALFKTSPNAGFALRAPARAPAKMATLSYLSR